MPAHAILVLSDIHVFPWHEHSVYDERGIPSRLEDYVTLARDLSGVCEAGGVETVVLAGDIAQAPTLAPMASLAVKEFLSILGQDRTTVLIPGQHDMDTKTRQGIFDHSVLSALVYNTTNPIHYATEPARFEIHGLTYCVRPWTPGPGNYDLSGLEGADVFVGHGMVAGSDDPFGYSFKRGFDMGGLVERFRLSVVGDVHQAQSFHSPDGERSVLVPGQPLQSNFSSGFPCGVWLADSETLRPEFVDVRTLPHGASYHYFRANHDPDPAELAEFPNTHYRAPRDRAPARRRVKRGEAPAAPQTLLETVLAHLAQLPVEHREEIAEEMRRAYEEVKAQHVVRQPGRGEFESLTLESFQSVQAPVTVEFARSEDLVLVWSERNGDGKTTLSEAFHWAITGKLTKDTPVAEISNDATGRPARVALAWRDGEDRYEIVRTRDADALLSLGKNGSPLRKGTAQQTQQLVYDVLGIEEQDVSTLTYFSLNETNLFSSFTTDAQLRFVARLSPAEALDALRERFREAVQALGDAVTAAGGRVNYIENRQRAVAESVSSLDYDIGAAEAAGAVDPDKARAEIRKAEDGAAMLESNAAAIDADIRKHSDRKLALDALCRTEGAIRKRQAELKDGLVALLAQQKELRAGRCYTCGQPLQDRQLTADVTLSIAAASAEAKRLATHKFEFDEMQVVDAEARLDSLADSKKSILETAARLRREAAAHRESLEGGRGAEALRANRAQLQAELLQLAADLEATGVEALGKRRDAYAAAAKLLDRSHKNPVYTASLTQTYGELVATLNDILAPIEWEVSLGRGYELNVAVGGGRPRRKGLSGGEKRAFDFAVLVALNRMYRRAYGLSTCLLNIQFYDEVMVYLKEDLYQWAYGVLAAEPGVKVVISNDPSLQALFESSIFVSKDPERGSQYSMRLSG